MISDMIPLRVICTDFEETVIGFKLTILGPQSNSYGGRIVFG